MEFEEQHCFVCSTDRPFLPIFLEEFIWQIDRTNHLRIIPAPSAPWSAPSEISGKRFVLLPVWFWSAQQPKITNMPRWFPFLCRIPQWTRSLHQMDWWSLLLQWIPKEFLLFLTHIEVEFWDQNITTELGKFQVIEKLLQGKVLHTLNSAANEFGAKTLEYFKVTAYGMICHMFPARAIPLQESTWGSTSKSPKSWKLEFSSLS